MAWRLAGIAISVAIVCGLLGIYVGLYLTNAPGSAAATTGPAGTHLYLGTVPAAELTDKHPTWVSYYAVDAQSRNWRHDTTFDLPAHTLVHVTIYNYDGQSGLRNEFISQAEGTVGGDFTVNGKTTQAVDPTTPSHVFAIPQIGVSVPIPGVADDAKNQCGNAPCDAQLRAHHDLVHLPHPGPRQLPLAVLRTVRGRVHRGLGRPDADRRVHGRLHQGRMSASRSMNEVNHWRRVVLWWLAATVIATPLVVFVAAPGLPPGNGTVEVLRPGGRQHGAARPVHAGGADGDRVLHLRDHRLPRAHA